MASDVAQHQPRLSRVRVLGLTAVRLRHVRPERLDLIERAVRFDHATPSRKRCHRPGNAIAKAIVR